MPITTLSLAGEATNQNFRGDPFFKDDPQVLVLTLVFGIPLAIATVAFAVYVTHVLNPFFFSRAKFQADFYRLFGISLTDHRRHRRGGECEVDAARRRIRRRGIFGLKSKTDTSSPPTAHARIKECGCRYNCWHDVHADEESQRRSVATVRVAEVDGAPDSPSPVAGRNASCGSFRVRFPPLEHLDFERLEGEGGGGSDILPTYSNARCGLGGRSDGGEDSLPEYLSRVGSDDYRAFL